MAQKTKKVANRTMAGRPRMYKRNVSVVREDIPTQTEFAYPLAKQLVGQQIDGVSLNTGSLLSRQYDDEFGKVDPACDIHTDPLLLQDALMRDYRIGLQNSVNVNTNVSE